MVIAAAATAENSLNSGVGTVAPIPNARALVIEVSVQLTATWNVSSP